MKTLFRPLPVLLFCQILPLACHASSSGGTLLKPSRMDLQRDGMPVGFVWLPAGTRVEVLSTNESGIMVRRSPEEGPFPVPPGAVKPDAPITASTVERPAAMTVPKATPSPLSPPGPSPAPIALQSGEGMSRGILGGKPSLPDAKAMNKALGIPLFGAGPLWEENDSVVAGRLRWPEESRTSYEAGYRRYPYTYNSETRVLGVKSLSLFLQGVGGHPARITILFANKGDIAFYATPDEAKRQDTSDFLIVTDPMLKACRDGMTRDKHSVETALRQLLGDSRPVQVGRFATTAESAQRWDWNGHSFLLSAPQNEYVAIRIVPTSALEDADANRKAFSVAKEDLPRRVEHRDNGDVILSDIPMVDQGRKGYCVPATFERTLRYYGLSEDMNMLAMAGQTAPGGGTYIPKIQAATCAMLADAGGRITQVNFTGSYLQIKPYIDAGKPVLFPLFSTKEFNRRLHERMSHRVAVNDWKQWKEAFLPSLKSSEPLKPDPSRSHVCLIVGYNASTGEIAISDSWGPWATERWMTEDEARQVREGQSVTVIE